MSGLAATQHQASLFAVAGLYGPDMVQLPQQPGGDETPPRRRRWIAAARLGVLLAALALIARYVVANADDFRALGNVSWTSLAAALGLDALTYVYAAAAILLTVNVFGTRVSAMEALLLGLLTRFGNLLLPLRGGAVARAVYLNRTHGLTYSHFLAGLSAMLLATLAVSLLFALGGLAWVGAATGKTFPQVTWLLAGAFAAVSLTAVLRPRIGPSEGPGLRGRLQRLLDGYHLVSRHRPSLMGLLALNGLHVLTMAAIYSLLLAAMGKPAAWGILMAIVALGNISTVVQLTPGNVGVYEAVLTILGSLMGIAVADILAAVLAWRAVDTALILVAGPISSYVLTGTAFFRNRG